MKRIFFVVSFFISVCSIFSCTDKQDESKTNNDLYSVFKNPPAAAKPFVRWWWNGNCIEKNELKRELDVMKKAGIGGVEINPIAMPEEAKPVKNKSYDWLSSEWNERVKATIEMAKKRNMVVDIIMGSGWPFGGEFLKKDQYLQGVGFKKLEFTGPKKVKLNIKKVWQLPGRGHNTDDYSGKPEPKLFFLQMLVHGAKGESQIINLINDVDENGNVVINIPKGTYDVFIGTKQSGYRTVMHGAPGSKGPVVNHYDAADVTAYMNKFSDALEKVLGGKLGDYIRAIFCDSIELSGANITDDFFKEFEKRRGYDLKPYMSLVYYPPYEGYIYSLEYSKKFNDDIERIRYDFNKTLVELFLERFTGTFNDWAHEHGAKSRYQAYGTPWLMGMLDGYRMVDIPESNNWLFSPNAKEHGYWIWNKYTSSAAHLSGAREVSSEAMTNTVGVFRATLNVFKKNDDFNFITGINHSVLHGYNYSPPEAGFPGWVRYGAYFNDQNPWWPYFHYWTEYNARLSALFQNSKPVVDVAILTPEADIWQKYGLARTPFYLNPWYNFDLWRGFSRIGVSADYINEGVLQRAVAENKEMKSEKASYKLVVVSGAKSILPETAKAIYDLSKQGVKFVFVDRFPAKTPSFFNKTEGDKQVSELMKKVKAFKNVALFKAPKNADDVTSWTMNVKNKIKLESGIEIMMADKNLYILKHESGTKEIYFFSNQDEYKEQKFAVQFESKKKTAWVWDPNTGERNIYPDQKNGSMKMDMFPLESKVIVLESNNEGKKFSVLYPDEKNAKKIDGEWKIEFNPFYSKPFTVKTKALFHFGTYKDKRVSTFAGKVIYETEIDLQNAEWKFLDLGLENQITDVCINGQNIGVCWWGRHLHRIPANVLKKGKNFIKITYITTLANYTKSLKNNKTAQNWTHLKAPEVYGLIKVQLLKSK